jgi:hypothetical protein
VNRIRNPGAARAVRQRRPPAIRLVGALAFPAKSLLKLLRHDHAGARANQPAGGQAAAPAVRDRILHSATKAQLTAKAATGKTAGT